MQVMVNADDFGLSRGVNQAISQGIKNGTIHTTSLMVSAPYVNQAIELSETFKSGAIGLHFTLTNGQSSANPDEIPLLVDKQGNFKNGFLKLLILSYGHPIQFRRQVAIELKAQLQKMKECRLKVYHIDGHRHVQMIPAVFKLVKEQVKAQQIPYVRIVNDSLWHTLKSHGDYKWLIDGGLIKWAVLKCCYLWNRTKSDTYFYGICHTGRMFGKNIHHISVPKSYQKCEIMIHPADYGMDTEPYPYPNPLDRELEKQDAGQIHTV